MSHISIDYEAILHAAGHRVTPQRVQILDAVCEANGHTSLGEVYARVRQHDQRVDRSTVYRALKLFIDVGLVVSADTGDGEVYFEIAKPHLHHHLVCRNCGKEQEIEHTVIEGMFSEILGRYGFAAESNHLVLRGLCEACRQKNEASGQ